MNRQELKGKTTEELLKMRREDRKSESALYYQKNRERIKARALAYHHANKDRISTRKTARYQIIKKEVCEQRKQYYQENKEAVIKRVYEYDKRRKATDLNYRLRKNLRTRLLMAIQEDRKAGSAVDDLGCTIPFLRTYLEERFQPGMTWDNWGNGHGFWNIDHVMPLRSFDLTDREQFLKACHYTNLQPLWFGDNIRKG